jgi:phosphate/sulfate permease
MWVLVTWYILGLVPHDYLLSAHHQHHPHSGLTRSPPSSSLVEVFGLTLAASNTLEVNLIYSLFFSTIYMFLVLSTLFALLACFLFLFVFARFILDNLYIQT